MKSSQEKLQSSEANKNASYLQKRYSSNKKSRKLQNKIKRTQ